MTKKKDPVPIKPRPIYSYAFKKEIVDQVQNGLISKRHASFKYLVSRHSIDTWCKKYGSMKKEQTTKDEIKKLKDRIEELELKNELHQEIFLEIEKLGGADLIKKQFPKRLYEDLQKRKKSK